MDKEKQRIDEEVLRKKILEIHRNTSYSVDEKAHLIQNLMTAGFRKSRPVTPTNDHPSPDTLTEEDRASTFHDEATRTFGCEHYRRGNRLQANCCGRWFTCRFCHDKSSDHQIVRQHIKNMLCMNCKTPQPAAQRCAVPTCGVLLAKYYCDHCKLWDDDPSKNIYHCNDCGLCRVGKGLGIDYFHCEKCNVCMVINLKDNHRCIERNLESDCPICGEFMFTSTSTVIFMPCGHCIHEKCHSEYIATSYQCPTCLKSLSDMSDYFSRIDILLDRERMPAEYARYVSNILCNDCEQRSQCRYHFIYNKCGHCNSYNTSVLSTTQRDPDSTPPLPSHHTDVASVNSANSMPSEEDDYDIITAPTPMGEINENVVDPPNTPEATSWMVSFFTAFGGGDGPR